jgi:hypothetical protein
MTDAAHAAASLLQYQVRRNFRRAEDTVQRRIEQIVTHHHETFVRDRLGLMRGTRISQWKTAWCSAQCTRPPVHSSFDNVLAGLRAKRVRQGFNRAGDERPIAGVAECQRIGPCEQPAENAMSRRVAPGAFVIHAASPEGVEHHP